MREYKFRGKRIDNGELIYGDLYVNGLFAYIIPEYSKTWSDDGQNPDFELIEVELLTVGQYTGLKDKEGKEIFEEDILKDPSGNILLVKWEDGGWVIIHNDITQELDSSVLGWGIIAGSIHTTPEILK